MRKRVLCLFIYTISFWCRLFYYTVRWWRRCGQSSSPSSSSSPWSATWPSSGLSLVYSDTHFSLLTLRWRFHKNCHLYAFASQPQRHQNSQPNIFSLLSQSHRAKALQKDYKLLLYLSNWFIQNFFRYKSWLMSIVFFLQSFNLVQKNFLKIFVLRRSKFLNKKWSICLLQAFVSRYR